jgi:hypothetical protein
MRLANGDSESLYDYEIVLEVGIVDEKRRFEAFSLQCRPRVSTKEVTVADHIMYGAESAYHVLETKSTAQMSLSHEP